MSADAEETSEREEVLDALEERLGYSFAERNRLERALTHPSFVAEHADATRDYQRLEFLGDAVLGLVITAALYERFPKATEGELSRTRSRLVSREALNEIAADLRVGGVIRFGRGELQQGGDSKPRILADVVEAVWGAIYLEGGIEAARDVILKHFEAQLATCVAETTALDQKSALQEYCQESYRQRPEYRIVRTEGPPHERVFTAEVWLMERCLGEGSGRSKQGAQQAAAMAALRLLESEKSDDVGVANIPRSVDPA